MAKDAVVEFLPVLIGLFEERCKCLCGLRRLIQHLLSLDPGRLGLLDVESVGTLLVLLECFNLIPPALSLKAESFNPEFGRINHVGESSLAKQKDVFTRPLGLANKVDVGFFGPYKDVTTRKAQELIAAATLGEIEGHGSLNVGPGLGRNVQTEGGSEGTNDISEWVYLNDGFEKLRTGLACVIGLAKIDVYIVNLVVLEKG